MTGPGLNGRNRLLAALTASDFALLAPHLESTRYAQGIVLQEPGEPIERVYFPESGMISLLAVMATGTATLASTCPATTRLSPARTDTTSNAGAFCATAVPIASAKRMTILRDIALDVITH